MVVTSKIRLVSIEIQATTPLSEVNPSLCRVPSQVTFLLFPIISCYTCSMVYLAK